jgi:hypothetical protein
MSLRTLHRRVREVACWRRPRLVAKGDPDREHVLADLRQTISDLPTGAVVLAEDQTHVNLLPWVRATWVVRGTRQQIMTPGKNRRRRIFGAVDLASGRWCYQITRKAVSVTFIAFLEQLLAADPAAPLVAVVCDNVIIHHSKIVQRWLATIPGSWCCTGPATVPTTTRWSGCGFAQGLAGQHPNPDHPRSCAPSACLLPGPHQHPAAGHRRPAQLTLAAPGTHAELLGGCLAAKDVEGEEEHDDDFADDPGVGVHPVAQRG